jgi:hypothetical protein
MHTLSVYQSNGPLQSSRGYRGTGLRRLGVHEKALRKMGQGVPLRQRKPQCSIGQLRRSGLVKSGQRHTPSGPHGELIAKSNPDPLVPTLCRHGHQLWGSPLIEKKFINIYKLLLVGARGFEPPTPSLPVIKCPSSFCAVRGRNSHPGVITVGLVA